MASILLTKGGIESLIAILRDSSLIIKLNAKHMDGWMDGCDVMWCAPKENSVLKDTTLLMNVISKFIHIILYKLVNDVLLF